MSTTTRDPQETAGQISDDDIRRDAADILHAPTSMEAARLAHIADVQAIQQNLATLPNAELMMLALGEIIAFMPKADAGGASREALWRELWRRGSGMPTLTPHRTAP